MSSSGKDAEDEFRSQLLLAQYGHVESQASLAATKASLLVAAAALITGSYISFADKCRNLFGFSAKADVFVWAFTLGGALVFFGLIAALFAVLPKVTFTGPKATRAWNAIRDLLWVPAKRTEQATDALFYDVIGSYEIGAAYICHFENRSVDDLKKDVLLNIWGKSEWLRHQFRRIKFAVWMLLAGTLLAVSSVFLAKSFASDGVLCDQAAASEAHAD